MQDLALAGRQRQLSRQTRAGPARFVSALQGSLAAGSAVGGIAYDATGPGGALIVAVIAALGATPVRYGAGVADRVRALGAVDAVFDAAGKGVLADAIALAGGPRRVITLADPAAAVFGVTLTGKTWKYWTFSS